MNMSIGFLAVFGNPDPADALFVSRVVDAFAVWSPAGFCPVEPKLPAALPRTVPAAPAALICAF
jgi:hypothetical protein